MCVPEHQVHLRFSSYCTIASVHSLSLPLLPCTLFHVFILIRRLLRVQAPFPRFTAPLILQTKLVSSSGISLSLVLSVSELLRSGTALYSAMQFANTYP